MISKKELNELERILRENKSILKERFKVEEIGILGVRLGEKLIWL